MSGIYIHIPFCKVKCNYCDFYKSTDLSYKNAVIHAIEAELALRKAYLTDKRIETIYLGGGTPSLLNKEELVALLGQIKSSFSVSSEAEITVEANPDDLTPAYLNQLSEVGFNRLSIGIQSFSDNDLKLMGRRHNAQQAVDAVKNAQGAGFGNISVDLIYGIPGMTFEQWQTNLEKVFGLNIQHLSAYHLTYHEGTPFWMKRKRGVLKEVEEEESLRQFEALIAASNEHGFIHYEISNFAVEGYYSKHNSSYWKQVEYLGLGPSAHSFNKTTRYWNPSNIGTYLKAIEQGKTAGEFETLTTIDKFNEYLITGLRTIWGIDKAFILKEFGEQILHALELNVDKLLPSGVIEVKDNRVFITKKGIFISDKIVETLFLEPDHHEY
jgi:oxygen-independent coproporphyrinogen-3 oxidase